MKGKNTLRDKPFRYGGILKDYSKEIHELNGHEYKCWCCGRDMKSHVPGISEAGRSELSLSEGWRTGTEHED